MTGILDRRELLKAMGVGSVVAASGLAGCSALDGDGGGDPSTASTVASVYAVDPAPVVEGGEGEIQTVFHDIHHRRVGSTVGGTELINHVVSYGHDAEDGAPEAPWTPPRLTAGVLSTPSTAGDGENPLATAPLWELLTMAAGAPLRRAIGLGSEVEWVRSPIEVDVRSTTALGTDAQINKFVCFVANPSSGPQARGVIPVSQPRVGAATIYVLRTSVDGTAILLGMAEGWETQSLELEDVDEQNTSRNDVVETATRDVERSRETMDDSVDALTDTDDDGDERELNLPPPPREEHEDVSLGSPAGLTEEGQRELGYRTRDSGTLNINTSYVTGRDSWSWDEGWDEDSFDRGTEYHFDIETVARTYPVDGDDTFPFGVVTAPLVDRHGEVRNPLATENLQSLLTGHHDPLTDALEHLDLYDDSGIVSWKNGLNELSDTLVASDFDPSLDDVTAFEGTVTQQFDQNSDDKEIEVHVVRKTTSDRVWVALLANVMSGDDYWDSRSNAREVFKPAVNDIEFGTDTPSPWNDIGVMDLRLVQTVADTRVQDPPLGSSPYYTADDVDLVVDEYVAPLFDLDVPATIPDHAVLEFDVDGLSDPLWTRLEGSNSLQALQNGEDPAVRFHQNTNDTSDTDPDNDHPVFRIAKDTASVSMDVRAPSGHTFNKGSSRSRTLNKGSDYAVTEVEPLRVGFIPIFDPGSQTAGNLGQKVPGERYGNSNGRADSYDDTVEMAIEYLHRTYPGQLYAFQVPADAPLPGKDPINLGARTGAAMANDFDRANKTLQVIAKDVKSLTPPGTIYAPGGSTSDAGDWIENNGFHATVAIVPGDYFEWYGNTFPFGGIGGITLPKANLAVGIQEADGFTPPSNDYYRCALTVAHELGHKFVADPYDVPGSGSSSGPLDERYPMAARNPQGANQSIHPAAGPEVNLHHARNLHDPPDSPSNWHSNNPPDDPGVVSNGFDLTGGTFRLVESFGISPSGGGGFTPNVDSNTDVDPIESYMSYSGNDTWADERITQTLINNDWNRVDLPRWLFSATGGVDDDGTVSFESVRALRDHPVVPEERRADGLGETVRVEMVTPDGETIASREVVDSFRAHDFGDIDGFVSVEIPFPLETAELQATRAGNDTTLNPIVRPVRDAVDRVPDRGIEGDPEETRTTVEEDLDEVAALMDEGDYEDAADGLTEFREPIAGRFLEAYESYQDQPTSEDLLDLVDRMIERLEVLAEYGGESDTEPTTVSRELEFEADDLSTVDLVRVTEQSALSLEFENRTGCPFDVFVVPIEQLSTYNDIILGPSDPEFDEQEEVREFARDHAPAELRFFDAERGSGTAELSTGEYGMVFHRVCEIGTRTEIEYTAEVGTGAFEEDDDSEDRGDTIIDEDGAVLEPPSVAIQFDFTIPEPATIAVEFENETGYPVDAYTMPQSEVANFLDDEPGGFEYVEELSFPASARGSAQAEVQPGEYAFVIENSADHGEAAPPADAEDPVFDVAIEYV